MYKPALVFEVTFKPEAKLANGIGTDAVKSFDSKHIKI